MLPTTITTTLEKNIINNCTSGRIGYDLVMQDDAGEIRIVPRRDQPCYGEMRIYSKGEDKPSDLHAPFPNGTPIGVGVFFTYFKERCDELASFLFSTDGIYGDVMKDVTFVTKDDDKRNKIKGIIFHDTKIDSDALVHSLILYRTLVSNSGTNYGFLPGWLHCMESGIDPITSFILNIQGQYQSSILRIQPRYDSYAMRGNISYSSLYNRKPQLVAENWLFYDRKPYHRDNAGNLNDIWKGDNHLFDFTKEAKIPQDKIPELARTIVEKFR